MNALPRAARPFQGFARLLRSFGFAVAPEQAEAFMRSITLLGPRTIDDLRLAALATFAIDPTRRDEFETLFRAYFHGEQGLVAGPGDEEDSEVKDDRGRLEQFTSAPRLEAGGALASTLDRAGARTFRRSEDALETLMRLLPSALPKRRSFRAERVRSGGGLDLRRALRLIARSDGDVPSPPMRRRKIVTRPLVILIDVSGSMKLHTADYLRVAHAAVQAADRAEVFTFGTRLTRITSALHVRNREQALARVAALVEDWDGGTRIGPTLAAFLSVPRFAAMARGAAVVVLSDGLERGGHDEMERAFRRLAASAYRLSLATPLAGDPRYRPETAALKAILPLLDDLVDGSSVEALSAFLLSLARPAPDAATLWSAS